MIDTHNNGKALMKIKRADSNTYSITLQYEHKGELALTAKEAGFYAGLMAQATNDAALRELLEWRAFYDVKVTSTEYLMFVNIAWSL